MTDNNNFFEVVPETASNDAVNEQPSGALAEYVDKARQEGFGETIIERAVRECNGVCDTYDDFLDYINKCFSDLDAEREREIVKKANIRRSVELEISRLESMDVMSMIDNGLATEYNTTAVTSLELVEECSKSFTSEYAELYKECKYAVYLCFRSDWVRQSLQVCLDRWDNSMDVKRYVNSYLKRNNVEPENYNAGMRRLVTYLPQAIQQENSPIMYKAFKAVQLLTQKDFKGPDDFDTQVLNNDVYYNTLADCVSKDMPLKAAEQIATSVTAKRTGIVEGAGMLLGRAVSMKYRFATSFDGALRESLGDNIDDFYQQREIRAEEKARRKAENDLRRTNAKQEQLNAQIKVASSPIPVRQQTTATQQVRKSQPKVVHKDFNPYIPTWLMFTLGGLVVSLITLLFGKFLFVLTLVGTSVASYGWFCQDKGIRVGGKSPILCIVGGYAVFILSLTFKFM